MYYDDDENKQNLEEPLDTDFSMVDDENSDSPSDKPPQVAEDFSESEDEIYVTSANERDARESGYMDAEGKAVELAKPDVEGSPTGALTDIGRGRSSVVHPHPKS
jgi:hypothetical protein